MTQERWERIGAGSGIVAVGLMLASAFVVPQPPRIDAPIEEVGRYLAVNRTGLLTQAFLLGLAFVAMLWFLGSLRATLRRAEGEPGRLSAVAFGAGLLVAGAGLVGGLMNTELAYRANQVGDPALARGLYDLGYLAFTFVWFPIAALVAATSVIALRTRVLPRSWGLAGGLYAAAGIFGGAGFYYESGAFAPGGSYSFALFLGFAAWTLATSAMLIMRVAADHRVTEPVPEIAEFRRAIEFRKAAGH